jgi:ubiquinone/menaquinone biosynthesis C-methylase UbiE
MKLARWSSTVWIALLWVACSSLPLRSSDATEDARRIVEKLGVSPGAVVAEIGGGGGDVAAAVAERLGDQGKLYVTEISDAQVASLGRRFTNQRAATVEVLRSAAEKSNLADGCCDGIYMRDVYHHFTKPEAMVQSLRRNLKPGGRLVVIDFRPRNGGSWKIPDGVPANRGGHGISIALLREELEAGGFRHLETIETWRDDLYAVIAEKPR